MKVAVIAANGKAGTLLTAQATQRGHDVTAIMRKDHDTPAAHTLVKDVFDLTREDLAGFDVILDAFGAWSEDALAGHSTHLAHLVDILQGSPARLLVVGGAGSLYVNPEHTVTVMQTEGFPPEVAPLAQAMQDGLDVLRRSEGVKWTYLSPAADFQADGPEGHAYVFGGEELSTDANGACVISYADYARAMLDVAESNEHIGERISVRNA
ncbi:NAD(P)H-binding protein [Cutibacterium equinum]|uniref:NAD(P)H-binding protein n=1 Tax=Cutibacterium equinum TaxID=3016342 RepID=A0ABY7R1H6_9ACTN|nr:NAD(P)H-binding protein [Cutibacterium equinum]WCC80607.1 NAD(P)H-binding protein [Cutibacterium equinum]